MMTTARFRHGAILIALAFLAIAPVRGGLYDDDKLAVKTGDIADQDYWWARFDQMMLDIAIKQKQPEGRISVNLAETINRLDELIKKYPNHEDLKKWKTHAEEINKKIDQSADRRAGFTPSCPWDESNYAQLWVNFHTAKMLIDEKQYQKAYELLQNVRQNYDIMLKPGRMKEYPDELSKWVTDNKDEADKMYKLAKEKAHN